jgi:hypothetical protein
MRSFASVREEERELGYATLDRTWNKDLWLLDPRTGQPVRAPLEFGPDANR